MDSGDAAGQPRNDAVTAGAQLPRLIQALASPEWRTRWRAAQALGVSGRCEAVGPLLDALDSMGREPRLVTCRVPSRAPLRIAVAGSLRRMEELLEVLPHPEGMRAVRAVLDDRRLMARVSRSGVWRSDLSRRESRLIEALLRFRLDLRLPLIEALGALGDARAVPALERLRLPRLPDSRGLLTLRSSDPVRRLDRVRKELAGRPERLRRTVLKHLITINGLPRRRGAARCTRCLARARLYRSRRGRRGYGLCPVCGSSVHVRRVRLVGRIGGPGETDPGGDELCVPLWDTQTRRARTVEVDLLEIGDGCDIDYDYAVNAVWAMMKCGAAMRSPRRIPVRITGTPALPVKTLRVLREEFGEVTAC